MPTHGLSPSLIDARAVLGVGPLATQTQIRQAFRDAAKRVHPDRPGGDAARFRRVIDAYRALQGEALAIAGPAMAAMVALSITPTQALLGGERETPLADGRVIRLRLPAGLRHGDRVRAGTALFEIVIASDGDTLVRGDDLWTTAKVAAPILSEGGRVSVETPIGRRIV